MVGEVKSRQVKIDLTVSEQREGEYGDKTVVEQSIVVPLPVNARDIADAVGMAIASMSEQVIRFRGPIRDESETAKIEVN